MEKLFAIALFLPTAAVFPLLLSSCKHGQIAGSTAEETYFLQEVKPLLQERCLPCHNGRVVLGGLDLTSASTTFLERPTGPVIVPGHPETSKLLTVILAAESDPKAMPPSGHGLDEVQILTLEKWIRNGAAWPSGPEGYLKPARGAEPRSVSTGFPVIDPFS